MSVNDPKVLYIITGVPGSGKYTLATMLALQELVDCVYVENSFEKDNTPDDSYEAAASAMAASRNIALSTEFDPGRYRALAVQFKYDIVEIVMKSTFEKDTGTLDKVTPAEMNKSKLELQKRLSEDWALL